MRESLLGYVIGVGSRLRRPVAERRTETVDRQIVAAPRRQRARRPVLRERAVAPAREDSPRSPFRNSASGSRSAVAAFDNGVLRSFPAFIRKPGIVQTA